MTPKHSGETVVVGPTTLGASAPTVVKNEVVNHNGEDLALEKAEEQMLNNVNPEDDEEISSFDEAGNPIVDTVKLENRMISVAIVRSVTDDNSSRVVPSGPNNNNNRYELRKRQRDGADLPPPVVKQEIKVEQPVKQAVPVHQGHSPPAKGVTQGIIQQGGDYKSKGSELTRRIAHGPRIEARKPGTQQSESTRQRSSGSGSKAKRGASQQPLIRPLLRPTTLTVPNPLANTPTPSPFNPVKQEPPTSRAVPSATKSYSSQPPSVPCPLLPVPCPLPAPSAAPSAQVPPRTAANPPVVAPPRPVRSTAAQVIPVAPVSSGAALPPLPQKRGRIFSIDIDSESLDFHDMNMETIASQDFSPAVPLPPISSTATVRQTAAAPVPQTVQSKSVIAPVPQTSDSSVIRGRDRAMSFEFFSFGINADEPLPPAAADLPDLPHPGALVTPSVQPTTATTATTAPARPRGDSIIFDPSSFLDGGILEEKALIKLRSASIDLPSSDEMAIMNTPGFNPSSVLQSPQFPTAPKSGHVPARPLANQPPSSTRVLVGGDHRSVPAQQGQMATLPSALNGTMNHATFQMDLLNKDGRIGIYLPEARKARIAKFHSKRKMRIWRKRIKYDCRKKLADSRPRVKGRFVKRSEMDEEE